MTRAALLAKVECCFNLEPDVACKGAEKAFVAFAERVSKEWSDESRRAIYGDNWFKSAVARVILFRAAEVSISKAAWYEGGYRAQIAASPANASASFGSILSACSNKARTAIDVVLRRLLHKPPNRFVAAHDEIDGVWVFGVGSRFRFRPDEFVAQRIGQSCHHLILQLEQVGHVFLEAVGPEMRAGFGVDELRVDAHPVLIALH